MISDFMLAAAVVLAVASPMTGSFLKCWADRTRSGVSVADGRSFCDNCGQTLAARDLVPVLSWIMAGGKSRCCRQSISPTLLLAEIAALAMAISAVVVLPQSLWLPALLLAWGLQAASLLTGAESRATRLLVIMATGVALAVAFFSTVAPITPVSACLGVVLGAIVWFGARQWSPEKADAAILLPITGALLGPIWAILGIASGLVVATLHSKFLTEKAHLETTSLAVGLATGSWIVWIGLHL